MPLKKPLITLFLLSLAVLVYELAIIRIFSVFMWYHFVSLSIALAMLGYAGGGLIVFIKKDKISSQRVPQYSFWLTMATALSILLVYLVLLLLDKNVINPTEIFSIFQPLNYRPIRSIRHFGLTEGIILAAIYFLISLPFWGVGTYSGLLLNLFPERTPIIYGVNLFGSGLGCLLAVPLLNLVSPQRLLLLLAFLCLAGITYFLPRRWISMTILVILGGILMLHNISTGDLAFDFTGGRFKLNLIKSGWNATSRVAIYKGGARKIQGVREISERYTGQLPEQLDMVINYTGFTKITRFDGDRGELDFTRYLITALGYHILEKPRVMILGAGGGPEVLIALAFNSPNITAVEINPQVVRYLQVDFAAFSGNIYSQAPVKVVVAEGRSYLKRTTEKYDMIQASQLYSYIHPQAGAFQMSENYFYTVEAFRDYWQHLTNNGIISFTHLLFPAARERLKNLALEALRQEGISAPRNHLFIASNRGMTTLLVKKKPFSTEELARLSEFVSRNAFTTDYNPGMDSNHHKSSDFDELDLSPPTDERPFFNYMVKPQQFWKLSLQRSQFGYNDRAILIIRTVFLIVLFLAVIALLLPALLLKQGTSIVENLRPLTFFTATGVAYMLVEIPLLKHLVFLLGQPIYSVSVTLFCLLFFGGIGCLSLSRPGRFSVFQRGGIALLLLAFGSPVYFRVITIISNHLLAFPLGIRILGAIIAVFPLGFLMGIPLAAGLSRLKAGSSFVSLGWAVNGLGSVLGAIGSAIISLNYGFTATLYVGMACYLIALLCFFYRGEAGWSGI